MTLSFTPEEKTWIENNENLINSKDYRNIYKRLVTDFGDLDKNSKGRRLAIVIAYLLGNTNLFRLRVSDRGPSRSLVRANSGQQILRIYLEVVYEGYAYTILYLKGTLNPNRLTWELMRSALDKSLDRLNFSLEFTNKVYQALYDEWEKNQGRYD